MSKRPSAPYRSGPSRDCIKVKNPDSPAMIRAGGGMVGCHHGKRITPLPHPKSVEGAQFILHVARLTSDRRDTVMVLDRWRTSWPLFASRHRGGKSKADDRRPLVSLLFLPLPSACARFCCKSLKSEGRGVLASQCLDRRIADKQILAHEVNAWQDHRNKHHAKANWQFKTADARVKLKRLYPQFG